MSGSVSDNPAGMAISKASRVDMRPKSLKLAPMTSKQVVAFSGRVNAIGDDILKLVGDMSDHLAVLTSQDKSSEQVPDQAPR
jgi:hypothetical protein